MHSDDTGESDGVTTGVLRPYNDSVRTERIECFPCAPIVWIEIDRSDQHIARARRIVYGLQHYPIQIQNMRIDAAATAANAHANAHTRARVQTGSRNGRRRQ
jgi:hypothetical protein